MCFFGSSYAKRKRTVPFWGDGGGTVVEAPRRPRVERGDDGLVDSGLRILCLCPIIWWWWWTEPFWYSLPLCYLDAFELPLNCMWYCFFWDFDALYAFSFFFWFCPLRLCLFSTQWWIQNSEGLYLLPLDCPLGLLIMTLWDELLRTFIALLNVLVSICWFLARWCVYWGPYAWNVMALNLFLCWQ